jgi:TPP-dependent 2-oxoacid decarboxylase
MRSRVRLVLLPISVEGGSAGGLARGQSQRAVAAHFSETDTAAHNGYLVERFLCKDPNVAYNDLAAWNYAEIPHALGCDDWYTARATTCGELDNAMTVAAQADTGVYIEVVTDTYAASKLVMQLHENLATLYNT